MVEPKKKTSKRSAAKKTSTKAPNVGANADGSDALERARALYLKITNASPYDSDLETTRKEASGFNEADAVAALDSWLSKNKNVLRVERGDDPNAVEVVIDAYGKLHPFHSMLLEHFGGFLEVSIDEAYWPHTRHRDGFRIIGLREDKPTCDLDTLVPQLQTLIAEVAPVEDPAGVKRVERWKKALPMMTTLEGITDSWLATPRTIEACTNYRIALAVDRDSPKNPRIGAPFAFMAMLSSIEERLTEVEEWKRLESIAGTIDKARFDARGHLRLGRSPNIRMMLAQDEGLRTVCVVSSVATVQDNGSTTGPLFKQRAENLDRRIRGAKVYETRLGVLTVRTDVLRAELTADALNYAISRVQHASRMSVDNGLASFDDNPCGISAELESHLALLCADLKEFRTLLSKNGSLTDGSTVECVGDRFPRVRWSYVLQYEPSLLGNSSEKSSQLWHTAEVDGKWRCEAELLVSDLSRDRVGNLMACLRLR